MSDLTATDVLIDPDEHTIERAREVNARMLEIRRSGWALDETRQPHITTPQRYVRTAALDDVYAAVEQVIAKTDMAALSYQATKIHHDDWGFPARPPLSSWARSAPRCSTLTHSTNEHPVTAPARARRRPRNLQPV